MSLLELLRAGGPPLAALGAALLVDRMAKRRGLDPPGFREPARRIAALLLVAATLYVAVFATVGAFGKGGATTFVPIPDWQLFLLQALFIGTIAGWFLLGFAGERGGAGAAVAGFDPAVVPRPLGRRFAEQFGFATPRLGREIGFGAIAGVAAWLLVLVAAFAFAALVASLFGDEAMPQAPPPAIPWIAGRPVLLRLAIALAAGVVEETFFRGFLQPRIGVALSTALFAMAHLSYDQPLMLVGITVLSLLYGGLVRWRQNLWPAIVAHFLFDAVQLLVVIPAVLKLMYAAPEGGGS